MIIACTMKPGRRWNPSLETHRGDGSRGLGTGSAISSTPFYIPLIPRSHRIKSVDEWVRGFKYVSTIKLGLLSLTFIKSREWFASDTSSIFFHLGPVFSMVIHTLPTLIQFQFTHLRMTELLFESGGGSAKEKKQREQTNCPWEQTSLPLSSLSTGPPLNPGTFKLRCHADFFGS